jgi:hypothetical protein
MRGTNAWMHRCTDARTGGCTGAVKASGRPADKSGMNNNLVFVAITFVVAILYMMRRRVRLGRRKPTF